MVGLGLDDALSEAGMQAHLAGCTLQACACALCFVCSQLVAGCMMGHTSLQGYPVEAQLYKVLVYEPGGHFAVHRDSGGYYKLSLCHSC
jgi:hypothetical protein